MHGRVVADRKRTVDAIYFCMRAVHVREYIAALHAIAEADVYADTRDVIF